MTRRRRLRNIRRRLLSIRSIRLPTTISATPIWSWERCGRQLRSSGRRNGCVRTIPSTGQNLGAALMKQEPRTAIQHFREMEAKFPNFEICHVCLGNALAWDNDPKGAEEEFRRAIKLDPSDPDPHVGL